MNADNQFSRFNQTKQSTGNSQAHQRDGLSVLHRLCLSALNIKMVLRKMLVQNS